jgi:hypothetical protein
MPKYLDRNSPEFAAVQQKVHEAGPDIVAAVAAVENVVLLEYITPEQGHDILGRMDAIRTGLLSGHALERDAIGVWEVKA